LDVESGHERVSIIRSQQAGEHFDGGRFSRAVGAKEAHNFARIDVERGLLHSDEIAIFFV
jgi:hypothetical protein